jgi:hypothetical protein
MTGERSPRDVRRIKRMHLTVGAMANGMDAPPAGDARRSADMGDRES